MIEACPHCHKLSRDEDREQRYPIIVALFDTRRDAEMFIHGVRCVDPDELENLVEIDNPGPGLCAVLLYDAAQSGIHVPDGAPAIVDHRSSYQRSQADHAAIKALYGPKSGGCVE